MSEAPSAAAVNMAQARVDEFNRQIFELTKNRDAFMDGFGRCGNWLDGHSLLKCRRLRGHDGSCGNHPE